MVRKCIQACTGMAQLGRRDVAYGCSHLLCSGGQKSVFWCCKSYGYLNCDWKRLEIPVTLNGFGCKEAPLAWSSSPLDASLIKCVALQTDTLTHEGMRGIAVKPGTDSLCSKISLLTSPHTQIQSRYGLMWNLF